MLGLTKDSLAPQCRKPCHLLLNALRVPGLPTYSWCREDKGKEKKLLKNLATTVFCRKGPESRRLHGSLVLPCPVFALPMVAWYLLKSHGLRAIYRYLHSNLACQNRALLAEYILHAAAAQSSPVHGSALPLSSLLDFSALLTFFLSSSRKFHSRRIALFSLLNILFGGYETQDTARSRSL